MQGSTQAPVSGARDSDFASIGSITAAVYDVISGPAGQKRDWDRMRSLFAPGARLIPVARDSEGSYTARVLSVEEYIERSSPAMEKQGFFEREIAKRVEDFGHIAHVFSTYESRRAPEDPKPFARGINSFQLVNDGKRWRVLTIFWEGERPENPIPPRYLK
jgi:hypothetical protein